MVKALFDTSILIDYLNQRPQARDELGRYRQKAISIITWMEVLVGASEEVESATRAFLKRFDVIAIDPAIAERAVAFRREQRLKLPDAIIWATADAHAMILVTRNTKDFPADAPGIRIPYDLTRN